VIDMNFRRLPALFLALWFASVGTPALAQQGPMLIRDAEIESIIRGYAEPIFNTAGIDPAAVSIYVVADNQLNAFVAGGQNLFLFTGLLMTVESPNQLIGVIAHETGHMAGGHIARLKEKLDNASAEMILAYILGIAAGFATGDGNAAAVVTGAGQSMITRDLLSYNRTQESAADQAALSYLRATGQSSRGLAEFLDTMRQKEQLFGSDYDPYLRSHPLTPDRMEIAERDAAESPYGDVPDSPESIEEFDRMRAKLIGFIRELPDVLRDYPDNLQTVPARYARAIAYYRASQLDRAFENLDGLLAEFPDDPYFIELKGQILYEYGKLAEALPFYERSIELAPDQPLLQLGLAQVLIGLETPEDDKRAVTTLARVVQAEPGNYPAWRLLSIAYGRNGEMGMAALAMAEASASRGQYGDARQNAARAQDLLPKGSPSWLRAQDILLELTPEDE
jgi:predicted Zn-dependent protease